MNSKVTLTLSSLEAGQVLDALYERLEIWRYTEKYICTGYVEPPYCTMDCSSANEASGIAKFYEKIIGAIERQLS